ncbi:uncharacterized protein J4E84_010247 [Alternaria hordeiaustralica]|uniref:uncharacterized protein n=1 Tax=Alternaria hordeiaustralica TaxID=1187925 RepID=UPI0020C412A8|nr:uncharacterized protein J4E84_010247 [Alternaria hordeiaustralica]KAI4675246.1 hypothetical protein J4E84_010247 [Alternaria hordeiaustralica]
MASSGSKSFQDLQKEFLESEARRPANDTLHYYRQQNQAITTRLSQALDKLSEYDERIKEGQAKELELIDANGRIQLLEENFKEVIRHIDPMVRWESMNKAVQDFVTGVLRDNPSADDGHVAASRRDPDLGRFVRVMLTKTSEYEHLLEQQNVEIANLKLQHGRVKPRTTEIIETRDYKDAFDRMHNMGFVMQSVFEYAYKGFHHRENVSPEEENYMKYLCTLYARIAQVIELGWKDDKKKNLGERPLRSDFHTNHIEFNGEDGMYLTTVIEVAQEVKDDERCVDTWKNPHGITAGLEELMKAAQL